MAQLPGRLRRNPHFSMDTNPLAHLRTTHELYCHLTGQKLTLRFDRERLWYEFLRAGFSAEDLKIVVTYLQKEIRASRRNVGVLKLSNLLQLDRFEDADLTVLFWSPEAARSDWTRLEWT